MKNVICINWGTMYGAPYINRLYAMVARNITPPFRFVAFTDTTDGVRSEVECFDLPDMPGEIPQKTPGKWQKARLWAPQLADLQGNFLFLDLDVVITDNIDPFFDYGDPDQVIVGRNAAKWPLKRGQTSVYRAPVGKLAELQTLFASDPQGVADKYRFEQFFVAENAPGGVDYWPSQWMRHFRIECIPKLPLNFFWPPRIPRGTRIVIFAGHVNPPDAIEGRQGPHKPRMAPWEYIKATLPEKRAFKKLQDYGLPATWVADHWRE